VKGVALYAATAGTTPDELVKTHLVLVKRIAYHLIARLPASVQVDDLIQAGLMGLLEAAGHYDASQGASFETYAGIRIRGAMLDEIRRYDWVPRSVHRKSRAIAQAFAEVERREGRAAEDGEVAKHLNMSLDEYYQALQDASASRLFSLDDGEDGMQLGETVSDEHAGPERHAEDEDLRRLLAQQIGRLPERERLVLGLYYDEELNLREIGEVMGVSESRVCQIHNQALLRLRGRVRNERDSDASGTAPVPAVRR
jgi:RNA polymerase sigma factor for flagellar operon FliA